MDFQNQSHRSHPDPSKSPSVADEMELEKQPVSYGNPSQGPMPSRFQKRRFSMAFEVNSLPVIVNPRSCHSEKIENVNSPNHQMKAPEHSHSSIEDPDNSFEFARVTTKWLEALDSDRPEISSNKSQNEIWGKFPSIRSYASSETIIGQMSRPKFHERQYQQKNLCLNHIRTKDYAAVEPIPAWVVDLIRRVETPRPDEETKLASLKKNHLRFRIESQADDYPRSTGTVKNNLFRNVHLYPDPLDMKEKWPKFSCDSFYPEHLLSFEAPSFLPIPTHDIMFRCSVNDFSAEHRLKLCNHRINDEGVLFPYLIVEIVPSRCDTGRWVSTNRYLTGSAVCVSANDVVLKEGNAVFGIVIDETVASFYIMWKNDTDYVAEEFTCFALRSWDGYIQCWRLIYNIHNWAASERVAAIKKYLDVGVPELPVAPQDASSVSTISF
ncbi:hypothetical protein AAE478_002204 [Parahypoxylon ruwenzoriense]